MYRAVQECGRELARGPEWWWAFDNVFSILLVSEGAIGDLCGSVHWRRSTPLSWVGGIDDCDLA